MRLPDTFFPEESRTFIGKRWGNVISRSLHLCGMAVYTGGLYFEVAAPLLTPWYIITAASGLFMMGADIYSNGKWIFQNRGFLIIIKVLILGVLQHTAIHPTWPVLLIIIASGVISHATAKFRYFSLFHGRQI